MSCMAVIMQFAVMLIAATNNYNNKYIANRNDTFKPGNRHKGD